LESTEKAKQKINWTLVSDMTMGYKRYLLLGALAVLLSAVASYLIPMVISFTVDYVIDGNPEGLPKFILPILDALGGRDYFLSHLFVCAITLVALTALNGLFTFLRGRSLAYASEGTAKYLRDRLYSHLQNVPYDYHKHTSTGDLVQRCTSDVDTVRRFISLQLLEIVRTVFMMAVAIVIMFSLHTKMALISMAVLPFLWVFSFVYFKYVRKHFTLSDEAEGKLSAVLQENLTGVRVVRAFGQQQSEMEKFTECNCHYKKVTYRMIKLLGCYWGFSDMLGYSQIAITLISGIYFAVTTDFTLGNILLFTTYTNMLTWPVRQLGRTLADLGKASVSLGRIDEILSSPAEQEPGAAMEHTIRGNVEFRNVCFGYDSPDEVLKGISFTAKPGETVAILGATGSGKSSLVHLLQRLYPCTGGEILIDGVNINDIHRHTLRKNIGIVLQEPFLYSRTIAENICIVRPDATEEEMHETARTAAVHDVIMEFENGYDTVVGERGVTLSGGQKQRVAIARTLMQHAPILIFDDSMSAVDTETDAAIRKALLARKEHSTTFIISHRITTLSGADKILVLEGGRLVQQGTHEELLCQEGLYARIAGIQTMLEQDLEGGDEA